jgi:hypothetical protein
MTSTSQSVRIRDPLLVTARIALRIGIAILVVGIGVTLLGFVLLVAVPLNSFPPEWAKAPADVRYAAMAATLVAAGIIYLSLRFVLELGRIVATVGEGDPFDPVNADRLTRMGWTALAIQVLGLILGALLLVMASHFKDLGEDVDFSIGALVMALVLFILARVFRHGAAMREDLAGTV